LADESVRFVLDAPDREGPLAGLASATETATADWLLVLGCDMPLVDDRAVEWLAARRSPDLDAVVPADDGGIHPLHAWYRREAVTAALSTLPSDASLRALLDRLSVDTLTADRAPPDADLERSVRNVNTVEDLEAARRAWQDR
jgi:molybdopterin-guanine dinucleotide biosynthesis protein A